VLYGGAVRAGLGRRRATLLGGAAAVLLGGWYAATVVIAGHGWYNTRPSQVPWLPIAAAGSLGALLAFSRIPVVARALTAPGMASRLVLPHAFRVTGLFFLFYLALGHLPALFALPAGLGDIAAGIAALLVALRRGALLRDRPAAFTVVAESSASAGRRLLAPAPTGAPLACRVRSAARVVAATGPDPWWVLVIWSGRR
jgi:hypothetical protein